jgi:hypothetical protein
MNVDGVEMIVKPRSETEYAVTAMWADALGERPSSIDDEFPVVNGEERRARQLLASVADRWKINVSIEEFRRASSIASLAALVERKVIEARTRDNALFASVLDELDNWR